MRTRIHIHRWNRYGGITFWLIKCEMHRRSKIWRKTQMLDQMLHRGWSLFPKPQRWAAFRITIFASSCSAVNFPHIRQETVCTLTSRSWKKPSRRRIKNKEGWWIITTIQAAKGCLSFTRLSKEWKKAQATAAESQRSFILAFYTAHKQSIGYIEW